MKDLVRVIKITPLEEYQCLVIFEDGTTREIDLEPYLHGPIFETKKGDMKIFRAVQVIDGTIGWDNGADIDPDVLYYELIPSWMEEIVTD